MTNKELYETIKQKIEFAENHYQRMIAEERKGKEVTATRLVLKGEIQAYTDILCLIESSEILEVEILNILKPNLSADLFNKEDEIGIIHLNQINIDKNSSQEEKDNFYKVRDYLRK